LKEFRLLWCTIAALIFVVSVWSMDVSADRQAGFLAFPAMNIIIQDGDKTIVIETHARTVGELLARQGINLAKNDVVEPGVKKQLSDDMQIIIQRNIQLTLTADGETTQILLPMGQTVQQALAAAGIVIGELDQCTLAFTDALTEDMDVQVYRITTEMVEDTIRTPYKTVEKESSKLEKGRTKVTREGITGKTVTRSMVYYRDGEEISRQEIETVVLREPVTEVVEIGTAKPQQVASRATDAPKGTSSKNTPAPTRTHRPPDTSATDAKLQTLQRDGTEFTYSKQLTMEVTAYTHTGRTTATGLWPKKGLVAVDPKVIPLGTKLYIEGYGFCYAEDTGVKGNRIDVFLETYEECKRWGRKRNVNVYIVD